MSERGYSENFVDNILWEETLFFSFTASTKTKLCIMWTSRCYWYFSNLTLLNVTFRVTSKQGEELSWTCSTNMSVIQPHFKAIYQKSFQYIAIINASLKLNLKSACVIVYNTGLCPTERRTSVQTRLIFLNTEEWHVVYIGSRGTPPYFNLLNSYVPPNRIRFS